MKSEDQQIRENIEKQNKLKDLERKLGCLDLELSFGHPSEERRKIKKEVIDNQSQYKQITGEYLPMRFVTQFKERYIK